MATSIGRLLRRTSFKPGESIMSLNFRLNKLNYVFSPWLLNQICRGPADRFPASFLFPSQEKTFQNLSHLTGISPELLYLATPHVFTSVMSPPEVISPLLKLPSNVEFPLMPTFTANKRLRNNQKAQYCPKCLETDSYHRLAWIPRAVTTCLIHECLLIDHCRKCNHSLSIQDIVSCTCSNCKEDLRKASAIDLPTDSIGYTSQIIIQSWLDLFNPTDVQEQSWGIPNKSPRILFRVLSGLLGCIVSRGEWFPIHNDPLFHIRISIDHFSRKANSSTLSMHENLAFAMQGIMNWPNGFLKLVDCYTRRSRPSDRSDLMSLGILYSQWITDKWQGKEFDFVRRAIEQYLLNPHNRCNPKLIFSYSKWIKGFRERYGYIRCSEAAKTLHVSPAMIKKLLEHGRLQQYEGSENFPPATLNSRHSRNYLLFDKQEVFQLRDRWKDTFTIKEAKRVLGISKEITVELVKLGVIMAERGPIIDGSPIWLFSKPSIVKFLDQIEGKMTLIGKKAMNMRRTLQLLKPLGITSGAILDFANKGILECEYTAGKTGLRNLLFNGEDVQSLKKELQAKNGWVSRKEASHQLGVKDPVLKRWVDSTLLKPVHALKNVQYFDRRDIDVFYETYIFCDEAAKIIGVGELVVQKWARNGRLHPVSGPGIDECHQYLFLRSEVDHLAPTKRKTAPQLARELGISRSQIVQWVKEGKIKPVSGPGIDDSGHYLFIT